MRSKKGRPTNLKKGMTRTLVGVGTDEDHENSGNRKTGGFQNTDMEENGENQLEHNADEEMKERIREGTL